MEGNTLIITSMKDPLETPEPINVKICNEVYLDPVKIVNYNGEDLQSVSYEFFQEAILEGSGTDIKYNRSYRHPFREHLVISSKVYEVFKYDLDEFVLSCNQIDNRKCIRPFKFHLEDHASCYEAQIDTFGYGEYQYIEFFFYFDPNVTLRKYTRNLGANIIFSHIDDYVSPLDGFFLAPNEAAIVSATGVFSTQIESFRKSKGTNRNGLERHDFTGEPFYTFYSPASCIDLCYAKYQTQVCNCSTVIGWNITNTECLDDPKRRECLFSEFWNATFLRMENKGCLSACYPKCKRKSYDVKVSKAKNPLAESDLSAAIDLIQSSVNVSSAARKLIEKLSNNSTSLLEKNKTVRNIAHLLFYFPEKKQWKELETIPQIPLPEFLSNIGGLVGMWLGISALTVAEWLEKLIKLFAKCWKEKNLNLKIDSTSDQNELQKS